MRDVLLNLPVEDLVEAIDISAQAVEMTANHFVDIADRSNTPDWLYLVWADEPNVAVRLMNVDDMHQGGENDQPFETGFARANHIDNYCHTVGTKIALLRAAGKFVARS